jgi:hypothetical protein
MTTPAPTPAPAPAPVSDGKTLGIVGLVLAFLFSLAGLIVSIIARNQSKRAGVPNGPATAGIIISIIGLVLGLIWIIVAIVGGAALFGNLAQVCATYGPGIWEIDGVTYTCS